MNFWLKKFLVANVDLIFDALHELADLTDTEFDDIAVTLLEEPVKEYVNGLDWYVWYNVLTIIGGRYEFCYLNNFKTFA